ncbi:hypothetical protein DK28_0208735 [Peptococcaceae bacterium SCADC1_2_3]|nr:hypothetical protein DK28_0208735 [Peptococcaceae bacterium SCADC1_2_3]KFI35586.1 hypothetical protein HY00_03585 [Peptococcaceae bacterium SCADC1_2_3]
MIDGEEINILGKGKRNGQELIIVGEAELKLTRSVGALKLTPLQKIERKVNTVRKKYPTEEIFKIIVTHFDRPELIEKAREKVKQKERPLVLHLSCTFCCHGKPGRQFFATTYYCVLAGKQEERNRSKKIEFPL